MLTAWFFYAQYIGSMCVCGGGGRTLGVFEEVSLYYPTNQIHTILQLSYLVSRYAIF